MDQRRPLGQTNLELSLLGLGTVKFGRNADVKYPKTFDLPTDEQITALLNLARSLGMNLIDTAPAYGCSEERLGQLLPSPRADWVIATKVGERYHDGISTFDFSPEYVERSVKQSCINLQCAEVDLVLIHSDGLDETPAKFGAALDMLRQLKAQGVIRAFGISPKTIQGAELGIKNSDAVMLTLNQDDLTMLPTIRQAEADQIGVIIKKGFASGHFRSDGGAENKSTPSPDPVEAALRFIFQQSGVTSLVVGTIDPQHLRSNAASLRAIIESST